MSNFLKEPPPIAIKVSPEEYSAWLARQRNWDKLRGDADEGAVVGNPDGGAKENGTVNAEKYYSNGFLIPIITTKIKPQDESIANSTTLQDDNDLTEFNLEKDTAYLVEISLGVTGSSNFGGPKFQLVFSETPQHATGLYNFLNNGDSVIANAQITLTSATTASVTLAAAGGVLTVSGYVESNAGAGGTVKLQWAMGTGGVSTTMFVKKGSYMRLTKI